MLLIITAKVAGINVDIIAGRIDIKLKNAYQSELPQVSVHSNIITGNYQNITV